MFKKSLRSRSKDSFQEPVINVTPLIDVVFVLLIAFIIIAPLIEKDSIELAPSGNVATHTPVTPDDQSPIVLQVLSDNSILVCGKKVEIEQLSSIVYDLRQKYPQAKPQLFHDKRASFGTYQIIKNCLESLGFTELDVVLNPS